MLWSSASFVSSVSGFDHLATSMPNPQKVVTVFGSSRPRAGDADYQQARELGHALAGRGFIVCTGGYGGGMGRAPPGAKKSGGGGGRGGPGVFSPPAPPPGGGEGGGGAPAGRA